MNHRYQSGSTIHIVIITILIAAVLGLLGFVFWQNFVNKPATSTESTGSSTVADETPDSTASEQVGTGTLLAVSSWGIQGRYVDGSVKLQYELNTSFGSESLSLTDPRLADYTGCTDPHEAGYVQRYLANQEFFTIGDQTPKKASVRYAEGYGAARGHAGDYYYFYTSPQASCSTDATASAIQEAAANAAKEFVTSLEEI